MNYENNFYYYPEQSGLTIIEKLNKSGGYEFDMFIIWQDKDGNLYYAQDSGCSCPTPFEDFNSLEELKLITHNSFHQFESDLKTYCLKSREFGSNSISIIDEQNIIKKVKELLK